MEEKAVQAEIYQMPTTEQKSVCTEFLHQINLLRLQQLFCDATLVVGTHAFPVHKVVLVATSMFFRDLLSSENNTIYQVNGISPPDFLCILDFLYTGQIPLNASNASVYKSIASQLKIDALSRICEKFLGEITEQAFVRKEKLASSTESTRQVKQQRVKNILLKDNMDESSIISIPSTVLNQEQLVPEMYCLMAKEHSLEGLKHRKKPVRSGSHVPNVDLNKNAAKEGSVNIFYDPTKNAVHSDKCSTGNETIDELQKPSTSVCEWCSKTFANTNSLYCHVKKFHLDRMHKCSHCTRVFASQNMLERHKDHCRLSKKEDGRFHCPKCNFTSRTKAHTVVHFRKEHTNRLKKTCQICGISFDGYENYYEHLLTSHGVNEKNLKRKVHSCSHCDFKTLRLHSFQLHQQSHFPGKFKCDKCNIICNSERTLAFHQRNIHNNNFLYKCTICNYTSKYKATLLSHAYRKHQVISTDKQKIYYCHYCDYSHIDGANFRKHEKHCHSDEKNFQCRQCNQRFKHKTQLNVHERIHDGIRPFSCQQCEYSARSRPALQAHLRHSHSTKKNYVCNFCGFATKGPSNLLSHMKRCKQNFVQISLPLPVSSVVHGSGDQEGNTGTDDGNDYVLMSVPEIFD